MLATLAGDAVRVAAGVGAVAVVMPGSLQWWDAKRWAEHTVDGWPAGACHALVADATGRWFAGGFSTGVVAVVDTKSGTVRSWPAHDGHVRSVALDEKADLVASGGADGALRIWPVAGSPKGGATAAVAQATFDGAVHGVAFSEDGRELLVAHRATSAALSVVHLTD